MIFSQANFVRGLALGGLVLGLSAPATAAGVEDVFKGKNISWVIGFPPDGGIKCLCPCRRRAYRPPYSGQAQYRDPQHAGRIQSAGGQLHLQHRTA
jgi:hypothetical protein